jgi:hypothetical protein
MGPVLKMWLENEVRLTNLQAMGKQLFLGNIGVLISKLNFFGLYSCTLPQKLDPLGLNNGFKVVVQNLMSSNHVNMGMKLMVDESTWLGFYPSWSIPDP